MIRFILGALLIAAPVFSQAPALVGRPQADPIVTNGKVQWFSLGETPTEVSASLGPPAQSNETGSQWIAWQYRLAEDAAHEDFTHSLLFERGTGRLLAVTRNYEPEQNADAFFPAAETVLHYFPNAENPQLILRVRPLPGGLVLTALGAHGATSQMVLTRPEMLPVLFPWIQ